MRIWDAELTIDEPLVRRLIVEPKVESLRLLSEGWDRSVWLVNERLVFAFPRREAVVKPIEPRLEVVVGNREGDVPWACCSVSWHVTAFYGRRFGIEDQEHRRATPEENVATALGRVDRESEYVSVESL